MKIENIELFELFMKSVCEATEVKPLTIAVSSSSTLSQQLDGNASLMQSISERYNGLAEFSLAQVTRQLERALQDEVIFESHEDKTPGRLLDYVYPVV